MTYIAKPYKKNKETVKSPLRYPGGKFYALKHIMPFIECIPHDEYREPFFGGGSVFFAKKKSPYNIINDLEKDIIDFYLWIRDPDNCDRLSELLSSEIATKERHNEIKNLSPSTDLERIFRTYYLNRTSYSGIINSPAWGYAEGKSSPPGNWKNFLIAASAKLQATEIYSKDFAEILSLPAKGQNVLIYVDPPYFHTDQKRAYTKPFELSDHYRVEDALKHCMYHFCLSYDDCPEIRKLYSWANINEVSWLYNTANRHGEKRKACKEIIITNYDVQPLAPST